MSWRRDLVDSHPRLFAVPDDGGSFVSGYPGVGDGWREILEVLIARIEAIAGRPPVRIVEVKEKHGTLRVDWQSDACLDPSTMLAVDEAISLAEARSESTCETCGRLGRLHETGSWLITACPDHARGEPVPIEAGHDGLHVVRVRTDGVLRIVRCRRYDRASDSFIDVDPLDVGVE